MVCELASLKNFPQVLDHLGESVAVVFVAMLLTFLKYHVLVDGDILPSLLSKLGGRFMI